MFLANISPNTIDTEVAINNADGDRNAVDPPVRTRCDQQCSSLRDQGSARYPVISGDEIPI